MSEIAAPGLSKAESLLHFIESLENLLDKNERKKIKEEIVEFHKLNDAEAKKAADAKALIKQHQAILDENYKVLEDIDSTRKAMQAERLELDRYKSEELAKIALGRKEVEDAGNEAKALSDKANKLIDDVSGRENALKKMISIHDINAKKLADTKAELDKQKLDLDRYKGEVEALDKQTNEKVEKLKKFNF